MTKTADVVVVGGGAIGLSIAFALTCAGMRPIVLDQRDLGREASWAGAGIIPPAGENRPRRALAALQWASASLYPEWSAWLADETGVDVGYRRSGGVEVAFTETEEHDLLAAAGHWRVDGVAYERLAPRNFDRIEPALNPELAAAYFLPDEAQIRNPHLLRASRRRCRSAAAASCRGTASKSLSSKMSE